MWYARRQSLRATDSDALLWSVRSRTCRKYSRSGEVCRVACWPASYSAQRSTGEPSCERWPAAGLAGGEGAQLPIERQQLEVEHVDHPERERDEFAAGRGELDPGERLAA